MTLTQSPWRTVFACGPLIGCLLCSLFILVLSFVLGFASFTQTRKQDRHEENLLRRRGWLGLTRGATRMTGECSATGVGGGKRRPGGGRNKKCVSKPGPAVATQREQTMAAGK